MPTRPGHVKTASSSSRITVGSSQGTTPYDTPPAHGISPTYLFPPVSSPGGHHRGATLPQIRSPTRDVTLRIGEPDAPRSHAELTLDDKVERVARLVREDPKSWQTMCVIVSGWDAPEDLPRRTVSSAMRCRARSGALWLIMRTTSFTSRASVSTSVRFLPHIRSDFHRHVVHTAQAWLGSHRDKEGSRLVGKFFSYVDECVHRSLPIV